MREIQTHRLVIPGIPGDLALVAVDAPGPGGACHRYEITGFNAAANPSHTEARSNGAVILFQNGPIGVAGVNGITNEVLLAIVADRLRSFQSGDYACNENAHALARIEAALDILHCRTMTRVIRRVEGTNVA